MAKKQLKTLNNEETMTEEYLPPDFTPQTNIVPIKTDTSVTILDNSDKIKHDNFRRLAEARVDMILEVLRKIVNLSSPNYIYTEDDVEKIFNTIQINVEEAKIKFLEGRKKKIKIF